MYYAADRTVTVVAFFGCAEKCSGFVIWNLFSMGEGAERENTGQCLPVG